MFYCITKFKICLTFVGKITIKVLVRKCLAKSKQKAKLHNQSSSEETK